MKRSKKDLLYDKENKYIAEDLYYESDRRDIYYSALVKDIVKNNRTVQVLKCIFFGIVCLIFALICVFGVLIIYNISMKNDITYSDIGVAITGFGSVLSSIIVLPKIIAKHLFPENSEQVRFNFIKDNQRLDQSFIEDDVYDIEENENDEAYSTTQDSEKSTVKKEPSKTYDSNEIKN